VHAGGPSDAWNIDERQVNVDKSQVTHRVTIDLTYSAIKAIKPNVTTRDLVEKWPKSEEFGWPDEDSACLMQWGHGIGLGLYEAPMISRIWSLDYPDKLELGMTFAVKTVWPTGEKSHECPRGQATRVEEMMRLTDSGLAYSQNGRLTR